MVGPTFHSPVFRIEHTPTGETHFCDNPSCGSNYFHVSALGRLVCNACEIPARLKPGAEFVKKDVTVASARESNESIN